MQHVLRVLTFAPSIPSNWDHLGLDNLRIGPTRLSLRLRRSLSSDELELSAHGAGPLTVRYVPQPGQRITEAFFDGRPLTLPKTRDPIQLAIKTDSTPQHLFIRYAAAIH